MFYQLIKSITQNKTKTDGNLSEQLTTPMTTAQIVYDSKQWQTIAATCEREKYLSVLVTISNIGWQINRQFSSNLLTDWHAAVSPALHDDTSCWMTRAAVYNNEHQLAASTRTAADIRDGNGTGFLTQDLTWPNLLTRWPTWPDRWVFWSNTWTKKQ